MNWIDLAVLVVWALTALWGFRTGLLRMFVPLVVVILGLAVSSRVSDSVGNIFSSFTANENIQTIGAFVLIFLGLFIIGSIVGQFLRTALQFVPLFGLANGLAGAAVGVVVGFLLLSGVLTGVQRFPVANLQETIDESPLGTFLADNFDVVLRTVRIIPVDWNENFEKLKEALPENLPDRLPQGLPQSLPDLVPVLAPKDSSGSGK
ncbi:MAG: hypothetical protein BZY88_20680 [SAR202 cluster bacterium Io17-Chloro-G9]|nr:MAG: hypothetical protein BZY88_20680 [SAR202 cluster bacterium Io17-Chloro-G9]